jgi:hypothetical protein
LCYYRPRATSIFLFEHELYSTQLPNYVKQEATHDLEAQSAEVQKLVKEDKHINALALLKRQVKSVSQDLKKKQPDIRICHVADREFDVEEVFKFIDDLDDNFVVRLKTSRLSAETKTIYTKKW